MEIGIIGLAQSGKSTIFEIMTGVKSREIFGEQFVKGIAKVPDDRFDKLVEIFKPAKVSPAMVPFIDVNATGENAWDQIRQNLIAVDGVLHIVDGFTSKSVDEIVSRYKQIVDEMIISDLIVVENRLSKLTKMTGKAMKPEEAAQMKALPKAKDALDSGKSLREIEFTQDELASIRGFQFWSIRPELVVLNIPEGAKNILEEFKTRSKTNSEVIEICGKIELEIAELEKEERKVFLEELGITTPAFEKIIRTAFALLGKIFYFTVGEDEVKAWVINALSTAPKAASAIHKDFERGFIKAEVVSYDDFISAGGSMNSVKAAGRFRLEGKEYIVKDGDIISFRFNV